MASVQLLLSEGQSASQRASLDAFGRAVRTAGDKLLTTSYYRADCEWLVTAGVGREVSNIARNEHIRRGGRVLHFDHGYFLREKITGHMRMSINTDHPQDWLDVTEPDPSRWDALGLTLRHDYSPEGPVILVGMGMKSRMYLKKYNWEEQAFAKIRHKMPGRKIIYRPKGKDRKSLMCEMDAVTPIDKLLKGAAFVVCHHSNVAVDAVLAGVPFHCEDGAAMWMQRQGAWSDEKRLDFLRRLAWWQWKPTEMDQCWSFVKKVVTK